LLLSAVLHAAPLLLSIDISCPRRAQQKTRRTPPLQSIDMRQTDGRTDGLSTVPWTLLSAVWEQCQQD